MVRPARRLVAVGGIELDNITEHDVVVHVLSELRQGRGGVVVTPNLDHLVMLHAGRYDRQLIDSADLVVADGMPLIWASWLSGNRLPERVAGSSLLPRLCEVAATEGVRVVFVGGRPGAGELAAARLVAQFKMLQVVAILCPPLGFEESDLGLQTILDELVIHRAELVFMALGAPKQELVNAWLQTRLPTTWFVACGGALDMQAGFVERAPYWMQRIGAEWFWRLAHEPRRLAPRYLGRDMPFAARLMFQSVRARFHRSPVTRANDGR